MSGYKEGKAGIRASRQLWYKGNVWSITVKMLRQFYPSAMIP